MTVLTLAEFLVDAEVACVQSSEESCELPVESSESTPKSQLKKCTKCGSFKKVGEFYKKKCTKDGLQNWCKCCTRAAAVARLATEEGREYNRAASAARLATEEGRAKNRASVAARLATEEGRAYQKAANARWYATEEGRAKKKAYDDARYATEEGRAKNRAKAAAWDLRTRRNGIPSPLADIPLQLYWNSYTSLVHEDCFKIGTGINAKHRNNKNQPKDEFRTYENLLTVTYADRADGFTVESWFKHTFKQHQYDGFYFLKSGNTELFNVDLMEVYNIQLIHENIFFFIQDGEIKTPLKKDIEIIEKHLYISE